MKLRSLRLHGFKSFADRTEIKFHEGLTAIVGPNGCGKSNISDAIRWVLGEQRPTAIRGAKMEEAIFQGSVNRRPVNRGSVVLGVSNEDGVLPVPFTEVEIGRTVYRDGGSEYSLNRSTCRLRDIHDLCRDTGLGANAYSIIESRMIDAILSDRAEERRSLFEEAAGIGKYKDRRKAASRRLERADLDLQRLDDVIAEVQTKVRSLARQKGKAQRYQELRTRRLSVEVAVVRNQLDELRARLVDVERVLAGDKETGEGIVAEVATAEAEYEALRIRQVEAEKTRGAAAGRLEDIRSELTRWERDLAVADERTVYAERRLGQIGQDRSESESQVAELTGIVEGLADKREALQGDVDRLEAALGEKQEVVARLRSRLQNAREGVRSLEAKEREVARSGAHLEGDAEAADGQAAELGRRLGQIGRDLDTASDAISDLESQGDLFSDRLGSLESVVAEAAHRVERAQAEFAEAKSAVQVARKAEMEAVERASGLQAKVDALTSLERDREGMEAVVQAALALELPGVSGILADAVRGDVDQIRMVEAFLGPLAAALVVEDDGAADRLREWFDEQWDGGGGLLVLSQTRVPKRKGGGLGAEVQAEGKGAAWVTALLAGVEIGAGEAFAGLGAGPAMTGAGHGVDWQGVLRIGNPLGATGVLERRERLEGLRTEATEATTVAGEARSAREKAQNSANEAEQMLEGERIAQREAEDEHRSASAEESARGDQKARVGQHREELLRQQEGAKVARAKALERAEKTRAERAVLLEEEERLYSERAVARTTLEEATQAWEDANAEESRVTVEFARAESELGSVRDRHEDLMDRQRIASARIEALDTEEGKLKEDLEKTKALRAEGEAAIELLFQDRDAAEGEFRARESERVDVMEAVAAAERRVREVRATEREATDRRHRLELERQELIGSLGRIQERLEGEWGRPLEALLSEAEPVEGDPDDLREEFRGIVESLERLGPVNMLAVEEHAEESERLEFLQGQCADLAKARDDLQAAIKEINQTATELFNGTFESIRENFRNTFFRLFQGGECDLWLADSDDPLESPIEIHASPRGKKTQRIDLLSGGERALTALSLLFGIYLVKPSPFCVLDEVDAPLDENNIGRFIHLLNEFKEQSQFVVITHNPRTIEAADWIYGVTMEEPGVSTIVGVRLEEALQASGGSER